MGLDFVEHAHHHAENQRLGRPPLGVGANTVIERAIIDKNVRIGRNVRIVNERAAFDLEDHSSHVIRDGVVVIPKSAILSDGTVI
jgi:glucose-1-phosphate adenylyltransferase